METATSWAISQLSGYLRGLTQRLDAGAGWYGEFLRRDPEGLQACLNGAAIPPWDVVESLLRDLARTGGAELAARETVYAARLRAAAVAVWDRLPGGEDELRILLAAAAAQRAESETALRSLTVRLGATTDRAETDALTRELSWTQDDVARAAGRQQDLAARLAALEAAPSPSAPAHDPSRPRSWSDTAAEPVAHAVVPPPAGPAAGPDPAPDRPEASAGAPAGTADSGRVGAPGDAAAAARAQAPAPVGRAEGRWLRGRRAGGARYAGAAAHEVTAFAPPPGHADAQARPAPRGARFGGLRPDPEPHPEPQATVGTTAAPGSHAPTQPGTQPAPPAAPVPPPASPTGTPAAVAAELIVLRAQGRTGEAHALLCQAAAWPAGRLPHLAAELARAGLGADWNTLLWEAASLPPAQLAAAAAALGEAGRQADCDAVLRQTVARPAAEVADVALALGAAGRTREADALLGAFVRVRTAEEAADLARQDPPWFTPRLLRAAGSLPGSRHRDLAHALRTGGIVPGGTVPAS
ncbi:hypothetical protein [Streptomyces sp. NRRL F-2664]|uniref:hypothetical protein n=1 Tax=Streptomyces sp. NRRL F-2664 TaxID=1463842 RepID=UPI0004C6A22A|nr:hypothetical protein [Streptomyces sp. NRRL F-2664]